MRSYVRGELERAKARRGAARYLCVGAAALLVTLAATGCGDSQRDHVESTNRAPVVFPPNSVIAERAGITPGASFRFVRQDDGLPLSAALGNYNAYLNAQLDKEVPSRSKLFKELAPFYAGKLLSTTVRGLDHDLALVKGESLPYAMRLRRFGRPKVTVRDDVAIVVFRGYVETVASRQRVFGGDRRFRVVLRKVDGAWKTVSERYTWLTPAGPGDEHDPAKR